jgi:hypothetical protein
MYVGHSDLATSTHSVGMATSTPAIIAVNTPTQVTVTVQIVDTELITNSVNLIQLSPAGSQSAILGTMPCNSSGVCTLSTVLNESAVGQVQLQVSAAFKGSLQRVLSNPIQLSVWNAQPVTYNDPSFTVEIPANWTPSSGMSSSGTSGQPLRSVSFSLPTDQVPVLYILIYSHGTDVLGQSDEPPGFLGSTGISDFYFQMRGAPADSSTLTSLGLTPAGLEQELLQVVSTFKLQ